MLWKKNDSNALTIGGYSAQQHLHWYACPQNLYLSLEHFLSSLIGFSLKIWNDGHNNALSIRFLFSFVHFFILKWHFRQGIFFKRNEDDLLLWHTFLFSSSFPFPFFFKATFGCTKKSFFFYFTPLSFIYKNSLKQCTSTFFLVVND